MSRPEVVEVILAVLAAIWAVRHLLKIVGRRMLEAVASAAIKAKICMRCAMEKRGPIPAEYRIENKDVAMLYCDSCVRKTYAKPGLLAWMWEKNMIRKVER